MCFPTIRPARSMTHKNFLAREFSIDFAFFTGVSQEQKDQRVIGTTRLAALRVRSVTRLWGLPRATNQRFTDNGSGISMTVTGLSEPFCFRLTESMSGDSAKIFPTNASLKGCLHENPGSSSSPLAPKSVPQAPRRSRLRPTGCRELPRTFLLSLWPDRRVYSLSA
jgi:hypothetical protein